MLGFLLVVREIGIAQLLLGEALRETERHRAPLAGEAIDQQAKSFGTTRHFVEDHRRSVVGRHHDVARQADLLLPRGAENGFDLAELFRLGDPFAQIGEGDMRLDL